MEKNKLIIIALLVIIVALLVGIFSTMPNFSKTDSKLEIIGNDTLNEGDNLQVKLTDVNGIALSNQTVNITITDENKTSEYHSVITNDDGVGELKLEKDAGKYDVTVIYAGNDGYNECNTTKKITINEENWFEAIKTILYHEKYMGKIWKNVWKNMWKNIWEN